MDVAAPNSTNLRSFLPIQRTSLLPTKPTYPLGKSPRKCLFSGASSKNSRPLNAPPARRVRRIYMGPIFFGDEGLYY
jgi:hypothetical protein